MMAMPAAIRNQSIEVMDHSLAYAPRGHKSLGRPRSFRIFPSGVRADPW